MTAQDLAGRVADGYATRFGARPAGIWFAPGRVNLIGEHTDYNQGFVLPFALSAGVVAAAGAGSAGTGSAGTRSAGTGSAGTGSAGTGSANAGSGTLAVWSRQEDAAVTVALDGLRPGSLRGWAAYPVGMAWSLAAAGYRIGDASVAVDSDLAIGAGLSSSAALDCAVGLALTELNGLDVPRPELAALASRAENDFTGAPTGIMDQSAALLCQAGHALLLDCRSGATQAVPLDPDAAGLVLLVIDTGVRHALTDGRYAARRRSCEAAAQALGVPSLRQLTDEPDAISRLDDPELRRRARHVVTENRRVLAAAELLRRGALAEVGPLLTQSHVSLRDDFEVSWPQADVGVDAAVTAGAAGARMMGGGFGGSIIALAPRDAAEQVETAVRVAFAENGWTAPAFTEVVPSAAARRLR
jgi:galactokinase